MSSWRDQFSWLSKGKPPARPSAKPSPADLNRQFQEELKLAQSQLQRLAANQPQGVPIQAPSERPIARPSSGLQSLVGPPKPSPFMGPPAPLTFVGPEKPPTFMAPLTSDTVRPDYGGALAKSPLSEALDRARADTSTAALATIPKTPIGDVPIPTPAERAVQEDVRSTSATMGEQAAQERAQAKFMGELEVAINQHDAAGNLIPMSEIVAKANAQNPNAPPAAQGFPAPPGIRGLPAAPPAWGLPAAPPAPAPVPGKGDLAQLLGNLGMGDLNAKNTIPALGPQLPGGGGMNQNLVARNDLQWVPMTTFADQPRAEAEGFYRGAGGWIHQAPGPTPQPILPSNPDEFRGP